MRIDLSRTFSSAPDVHDDGEDWSDYLRYGKEKLTWKDVREKPIAVVVGEAGIGKTIEFELESKRLTSAGIPAFFVALNQLVDSESWERALADSYDAYERWKASTAIAYFLLDAVDEARLTGQAALEQSLSVVPWVLRGCMSRARFIISSRPTDWAIDGVRAAVDKHLCGPIAIALSAAKELPTPERSASDAAVNIVRLNAESAIDPLVVSLEPLSISEAKRLAAAFNVLDGKAFWDAVSDGNYAFMATRPLDLGWMVRLWNEKRSLGTFRELIEFNVENRLAEVNSSYLAAGAALSKDRLREGAEELAAAAELSGRAYIAIGNAPSVRPDEVAPSAVLSGWSPNEVARVLSAAVFDEATFGRVRFHHRTTRAYLAACWVNRQLVVGVPFHRVLTLFTASPFGTTVLIPSRRWALCWLAAINVEVREWITRRFPEMLIFDGDPEAWDSPSIDRAFLAYVERLKSGLRTDWYNNESEFRRVGRRLSPGLVASVLATAELPTWVTTAILPVAKYGRLTDCAQVVFGIYRNSTASQRERRYALDVLETIATPQQRATIKEDLVSGALTGNGIVASALPATDWQDLSVEQLVAVFRATEPEEGYGTGPVARAVKEDLLQAATATSAELLLKAVLQALPRPEAGRRFAQFPESAQPERAWLLDVLPDCLERLLTLLPRTHGSYPDTCLEAAERLEALRDTGFTDREEFRRIHALIANHPGLRWQVALGIAQSENITHSMSRLAWGVNCLVSFTAADVPELIGRSNDVAVSQDVRDIWFTVALDVAIRGLRGRARTDALAALAIGTDEDLRRERIAKQRANWISGAKHRREWKVQEFARRRERQVQHAHNRAQFLSNVEHIRDASHRGSIHWLVHYSYDRSDRKSFTRVDYEVIANDFGQIVADALATGLKVLWASASAPNPSDHKDGSTPWEALTALAGLHTLLEEGLEISSLPDADASRAAKLAVWELNGPPNWFEPLANRRGAAVAQALQPWIEVEAQLTPADTPRLHGALGLALRCSAGVSALLLAPLAPMINDGHIGRPETLKEIVKALRATGLVATDVFNDLCRARVIASLSPQGLVGDMYWLRTWLEEDTASAWGWFEEHVANSPPVAAELVKAFAKIAQDCKWVKVPADAASTDVLLRLHRLLTQHQPSPDAPVDPEDKGTFEHVVAELRSRIPGVFVQSRGAAAHLALVQLMAAESVVISKRWLAAQVAEHAALEAATFSQLEPGELNDIGSPFLTAPKTEAHLFEQVVARLEEVRKGTEEGPFSDRDLFHPKMPEKYLQSWLAARFRETQNRRFTVTREEQVDDDKEPDIQLGCAQGKVCVEIKPLYSGCGYSAISLTDTLRTQLVKQYLKGYNSGHGILVLFRLDNKSWDIPGGARRQPFSALLQYLQVQADIIKARSTGVVALQVFGINCTI